MIAAALEVEADDYVARYAHEIVASTRAAARATGFGRRSCPRTPAVQRQRGARGQVR
jgi:hypothetical protein